MTCGRTFDFPLQVCENGHNEGRDCANSLRPSDRPTRLPSREADAIMAPPLEPVSTTPATFAERMARVDGCPNACENYEPPRWVKPAPNGFLAGYRCGICRESWVTAWGDA